MAVRPLLQAGDPGLKVRVRNVGSPQEVTTLMTDLIDSMRSHDLIGIAATQIGEPYAVFVTELRETPYRTLTQTDGLRVYINPKLTHVSDETVEIYEGCGSVTDANVFGPVARPREITVTAWDEVMRPFELTCDGILARVVQHEIDHLHGIEFTQKVTDRHLLISSRKYVKEIKPDSRFRPLLEIRKKDFSYLE